MASLARRSVNVVASPTRQLLIKRFNCSSVANNKVEKAKGLSTNVVTVPDGEVGPGASKSSAYKNPEYFCYDQSSFFEAEVELNKYRLPQPSNKN